MTDGFLKQSSHCVTISYNLSNCNTVSVKAFIVKNIDTIFFACLVRWLKNGSILHKQKIKAQTLKYGLSHVKMTRHLACICTKYLNYRSVICTHACICSMFWGQQSIAHCLWSYTLFKKTLAFKKMARVGIHKTSNSNS